MNTMMMKMSSKAVLMALLAGGSLTGCLKVKEAVAPISDPVQAVPLESFSEVDIADETGELALRSNRLFLWREGVTPDQVAATLETSRELDRLEETRPALEKRIKGIEDQFAAEFAEEDAIDLAIRKSVKKVEKAQKAYNTEFNKPEGERSETKLADLKSKLEVAQAEEAGNRARLEELYQRGGYGEARAARLSAQAELSEIEVQIQDRVAALDRDVEYFQTPPTLVRFKLANRFTGQFNEKGQEIWAYDPTLPMEAKFDGWKLPGESESRSFSTENGLMQDLVFRRKGGVLTFKIAVYEDASLTEEQAQLQGVAPKYSYCFRLVRNRYDQIKKDPRKFFGGEMFQIEGVTDTCEPDELKARVKKDPAFKMRQGIVKMQDKASKE